MSDWPANASVSAAHAATKRECFMVGAIVYEAVIRAVRVFRGSNWPVPWDIHDERAGDAVVPRLPLGIPKDPQKADAREHEREDTAQSSHQRFREMHGRAVG